MKRINIISSKGNRYSMYILNCEKCNKEIKRTPSYITKNNDIICRTCSNKDKNSRIRIDKDLKICKCCNQKLTINKFNKSKKGVNFNPICSKCYSLKKFGINRNDYDLLLIKQNNKCAICNCLERSVDKRTESGFRDLAVDHCHKTGIIRGLLCTSCNTLLGNAKDNIEILQKSIEYLKRL